MRLELAISSDTWPAMLRSERGLFATGVYCMSTGMVTCATPREASAVRQAS